MNNIEQTILNSFIKYMGEEVKGLDLMVAFSEDTWPDDISQEYVSLVMETKDNGKVWEVVCTRSGKVKDAYLVG